MSDNAWVEGMAQRARQRAATEQADQTARDPHSSHHTHLRGTAVECSCGELFGVTCVAVTPDNNPDERSCDLCGVQGVVRLNGANQ
ncbi:MULTISPECIES: hypothetical protein [unclassified Micromonospora]|uniref:hypothetical protein n=1 Tax=unclassified Micromonospora TaxID=2617518 RepID=UPI003317FBBB